MMKKSKFGIFGIVVGSMALLLVLVHFWAGPFSPPPTSTAMESFVHKKVTSIRQAAIDAVKGKPLQQDKQVEVAPVSQYDNDKIADIVAVVLGGLAVILAVISFVRHEPKRIAGGAVALGLSAITFQFIAMYAMAVLGIIMIVLIISAITGGGGF